MINQISNYDVETLDLSDRGLTELPDLSFYKNLKILNCSVNLIKHLYNLPNTLEYLDCSDNKITQLDYLPITLKTLICAGN